MKTPSNLPVLADKYITQTCVDYPQWGSGVGYTRFESRLAGSDETTRSTRNEFLEKLLSHTEAISPVTLNGDEWLDRRCFLSLLRTELLNSKDLERWRKNPQESCDSAVGAVFELIIRHSKDLKSAIPSIESRLEAIPRFLSDGAAALRSPVPLWSRLAVQSCIGAAEFLSGLGERLSKISTHPKRILGSARRAAKAFEDYSTAIRSKKQGRPGDYAIGRSRFEYLVRERAGLDMSLPEIEAEGHRLIGEVTIELEREARKIDKRSNRPSPAQILTSARNSWVPDASLLELYTRSSAEWRKRIVESGLYTIPSGETLEVIPVPDFMREHFPTAAYTSPGAFERRQRGIFWVNDLGAMKTNPAESMVEIRQHFGLELTAAHEGYPGHHLQFAIQNRHPSRIRRICSHAIFYEGWTMWTEKLAVERGWVQGPYARLQQLHDALWRAYRIVIDCGLHSGKLTHEAAAQILVKGVGFTPSRARADVNWYTSQPTVPMSYLLGRLELERIKSRLVDGDGWSLRKFHDWALSHGAVPWTWIERSMATDP